MVVISGVMVFTVVATGVASQYDPGVMERTIRVRQAGRVAMPLPQTLPETDGAIAVLECGRIGETWYFMFPDGTIELFLIADCAGDASTRNWMVRNNILAEVDGPTALRHRFVGRGSPVARVELIGTLSHLMY